MLQSTEKGLEEFNIAKSRKKPRGLNTVYLPLDMLDPICKIQEPHFYEFIKESVRMHGLYHPLVIHPITVEEWAKELEMDSSQTPPPMDEVQLRYRVQCGCNRWYALKELGYDAVECIVIENLESAKDLCHVLRVDKRWQRGSNWEEMHGN